MHSLTIFLLCLIAGLTLSKSIPSPKCALNCNRYCAYGNVLDSNGCPICTCRKSPCDKEQTPLPDYFCGRGPSRRECPSTHYCKVAPNDAYAVCCPAQKNE